MKLLSTAEVVHVLHEGGKEALCTLFHKEFFHFSFFFIFDPTVLSSYHSRTELDLFLLPLFSNYLRTLLYNLWY